MAILQIHELDQYAPGIDISNVAYTTALLARCQGLAESALGANRALEVTEYQEIHDLSAASTSTRFYLYHAPIILSPEPKLQMRQGVPSKWADMNTQGYSIDNRGYVEVSLLLAGSFRLSLDAMFPRIQVRAVYSSGFDFSATSNDVVLIKSIVAQLAQIIFISDGGSAQLSAESLEDIGIEEFEAKDDSKVKYSQERTKTTTVNLAAEDKLNKAISNILFPLKKYSPRSVEAT